MKMTKTQLRRVIREAVNRKLQALNEDPAAGGGIDMTEPAEFLIPALVEHLESETDLVTSNAWEMMMGTLGEEEVPVPGRVEDVDHFADKIADRVMASPDLKEVVKTMARLMLESAMDNFGTPGPGGR